MLRSLFAGLLVLVGATVTAQPKPAPIARLFFQDAKTKTVKFAEVLESHTGELTLSEVAELAEFPKLDADKQSLVQMAEAKGRLVIGIRDNEDGEFGSGWAIYSSGVKYTSHGDHGHWSYRKKPQLIASKIDKEQGNPAHVYCYDEQFYIANDMKNGYTRLEPADFSITASGKPVAGTAQFLPGGGGHITLATVDNTVGYGSWIDAEGANKGRVDVTKIGPDSSIKYSFSLPTGVIHGATAAAGKVFFAPADGLCWVEADKTVSLNKDAVKVGHISLGKQGEKPLRVGAFENFGKNVLAVTGTGAEAKLIIVNAEAKEPTAQFVSLGGQEGHRPTTPVVTSHDGKHPLAVVFHDHVNDAKVEDLCELIELDPNGDGDFADAKVVASFKVPACAVAGHSGHHAFKPDGEGQFGYFTNPGDSSISVLNIKERKVTATFKVEGKPTALIVVGAKEVEHD